MSDIKCPYCEQEQDVNHDDGYGYEEYETHQMQCCECNKYFVFTTSIYYSYSEQKADCLNDEDKHEWKPTITCPVEATKMRCVICDERRKPTESEMINIKNK